MNSTLISKFISIYFYFNKYKHRAILLTGIYKCTICKKYLYKINILYTVNVAGFTLDNGNLIESQPVIIWTVKIYIKFSYIITPLSNMETKYMNTGNMQEISEIPSLKLSRDFTKCLNRVHLYTCLLSNSKWFLSFITKFMYKLPWIWNKTILGYTSKDL